MRCSNGNTHSAARVRRDGHVVFVRPELVVEIATIPEAGYPGDCLGFARVKGYRPTRPPKGGHVADAAGIYRRMPGASAAPEP